MPRLKNAISRGATISILVVIIIIVALGGYEALYSTFRSATSSFSSSSSTSQSQTASGITFGTTVSRTTSSISTSAPCIIPNESTTSSAPKSVGLAPPPSVPFVNSVSESTTSNAGDSVAAPNSSQLVDESPIGTYDSLDPGVGFFITDGYFANVFQGLVAYPYNSTTNSINSLTTIPALASNVSVSSNYEQYNFTMRPNTHFSNNDTINAYTAWFSFVRELYMNNPDGSGITNYAGLTLNVTNSCDETQMGNQLPDGLWAAVVNAGHVANNQNAVIAFLNGMLSNFNSSNATQEAVMSYSNQAYVVLNSTTFQINLIQPYRLFLLDLPNQWGAIVDPSYVDDPIYVSEQTDCYPSCVTNNTSPPVFSANGMVGSGPYMYQTNPPPAPGNSLLILNANPNYWGKGVSNLNPVLEPAQIPTIKIEFGNLPSAEISNFTSNEIQIVAPSIANFNQLWSSFHQNFPSYSFNQIFINIGYPLCDFGIGINTQAPWTNSILLREAIVHAINYTQILQAQYTYNSTSLGELFLPPAPPGWGPLDNPQNISLYSYNITLALELVAQAGEENGFYVTLPNGSELGDSAGIALSSLEIQSPLPATAQTQQTISILNSGLYQIGIILSPESYICGTAECGVQTPSTSPQMSWVGWCADYSDPIYQQFYDMGTTIVHQANWVNNATLTNLLQEIPFETNLTLQIQQTEQAYDIFTQLATIIQLPNPATYFFVQPYVQGLAYSPFQFAIYYNMLYYS